jgi:SAM-dependent methyltransferase
MDKNQLWQLGMFRKGLKKNLRLKSLKRCLRDIGPDERCLLVSCGDNNGAMNYFLREVGGKWSWADLENQCIPEMSALLGEEVRYAADEKLPFENETFDRIVSIDVHEHVDTPENITGELYRVAKCEAQIIITVPNGDESKLAVRIKHALDMTKEAYGHKRVGFTVEEVKGMMTDCRITPVEIDTYSRFFTEMLELSINFVYVKILNKDDDDDSDEHGEIAPATEEKLQSVSKSYRIYSLIFPVYWLLSKLDYVLLGQEGYCVLVAGRKATA